MSAAMRPDAQRVVVTGMGIVSCLGNALDAVADALRASRSGLTRIEAWAERGLASQVAGAASVSGEPPFARKFERFMGDTARFACHAARMAIDDARLAPSALHSPGAGAVIGSGTGALSAYDAALALCAARGIERTPPFVVPQAMSSTVSANVAHVFGLEGVCYSPSSACTTSALAIGQAMHLIQTERQQIVLAGGSEELHENTALMFDAMGVLSRGFNDAPQRASRPYDVGRDGFVLGSGAGVLVLESLAHARARGASIYAELTGFGQATDAHAMVAPGAAGIARALRAALDEAGVRPDYVNTHAPSTPLGDAQELDALVAVFGERMPPLSSTKALTGHPLAAAGVHEVIYTLLMMRDGFVAASAGIESLDPCFDAAPIVRSARAASLAAAMSVSFGFGGSCASLMFGACAGGTKR
ncbi:beta-ketoacyl-[acyl-carrier-protein] synthase I [Trinickia soli]|jgi:3-oxoacyl-[acyl-carrier-protein] synthase-1|uniref:3-oxoacyl-[acyl-carrier-protein] synthase 1 n=2 Tax=Trinickia soli TaxID=380675 RepID=A0A2N7WC58_9BURK|nr:beta-ketoacyl synthase N-terminal-like domain-containing protein [Trinickia soli]KAA0088723.1 beta-ketoacyl-ACP synthase I [Paraburkholderia sp. T12-10]PMS26977.1 beta-ketoacyl-[acyl-carrier-protein] synthase I [Trinickia soli]